LSPVCAKCRTPFHGPNCRACGAVVAKLTGEAMDFAPQLVESGFLLGAPLDVLALILQYAVNSREAFQDVALVCREWLRAIEGDSYLRCCLASVRIRHSDVEPGRRIATASYGIVRHGSLRSAPGSNFAIKSIDAAMGWDKTTVESLNPFTLSCRNIASPLATWIEGDGDDAAFTSPSLVVVEEFCDRGSLADLAAACEGVPERILAGLAKQMCQALAFLHHEKLRSKTKRTYDLTPADFLLTSSGTLKVSTTPVAKSCSSGAISPQVQKIYLAPELILGQPWRETADSWTVGIILMELALGHYPFHSVKLMDLIHEITTCKALQFPLELSSQGLEFLFKCVASPAEKRSTMSTLLKNPWMEIAATEGEIAHWLTGVPIVHTSP